LTCRRDPGNGSANGWGIGSSPRLMCPTGSGHLRQSYSFDLTAESIGEGRSEPLLSGGDNGADEIYWEDGPGWVAHLSLGPRTVKGWEEWLEWLAPKFRIRFQAERVVCNRVRFLDADTGRLRYELPNPVRYPCTISSDGKRLACMEPGGVVAVWDADPPPRWPWTLVAGLIGAGFVLIFGRWRSRRLLAVAKAS
jgi:hypothetical protein